MTLGSVTTRAWIAACALGAAACNDKPKDLAPAASALSASNAAPGGHAFSIDKGSSKVEFMMEAPQEKIRGRAMGASEGELSIDPVDVTKTTGLIVMDLVNVELFQTKADDKGDFGQESKSDLQNQHARTWLEISDDTPAEVRRRNERVEFAVRAIRNASAADVTKLPGAERKVTFEATGDLLLHGHKKETVAELEATFQYQGDTPMSVAVRSTKPFAVALADFDVRPREAFGKLAQKTLEVLSPKVAKEALVSIALTAMPKQEGASPAAAPKK